MKLKLNAALAVLFILTGCTTVSVYQDPITKFQTSVNSASSALGPYLVGINQGIYEANLYDKIGEGKPWGIEDVQGGIPMSEIQLRLNAVNAIASYVNALAAMASGSDETAFDSAAKTLGTNLNGLSGDIQSLAVERLKSAGAPNSTAAVAKTLNIGDPITALVTLVGNNVIEGKERSAVESAIVQGQKPIDALIDLLSADLTTLNYVTDTSYEGMEVGKSEIYQQIRAKATASQLPALIDQFVQDEASMQTLRTTNFASLLSDLKKANDALATFVQSKKAPKDLSDLASQISVFSNHVQLVTNALTSFQSLQKPTK